MHYNSKFDREQRDAVKLMHAGANVFLDGGPGSGKTFCLDEFKYQNTDKNVIYLAPTGIAAHNINGMTIHRFFSFNDGILDFFEHKTYSKSKLEVLRRIDCIVIDEISMVSALLLDAIDRALRLANNSAEPFASKQIIVSGDFHQLPPVVTDDTKKLLDKNYDGYYAFCAKSWKAAQFHTIELKGNYRQDEDRLYRSLLKHIRNPISDSTEAIQYLNECEAKSKAENKLPDPSVVNLCARNKDAFVINKQRLDSLPGKAYKYSADTTGMSYLDIYPVDIVLEFKVGAKVMLLNNTREYANGSIGYVIELANDKIVVKLEHGKIISVEKHQWYDKEYSWDEFGGDIKVSMKTVGTRVQYPLKLAWAISIHKAQGMSLDAANIILGDGMFSEGQLYVALSRVRHLEGLRLDKPIDIYEASLNPQVTAFYEGVLDQTLI